MFKLHKKAPREKSLLGGNDTFSNSSSEGDTIAERIKQRRRGDQTETKRDEFQKENPFVVFEQQEVLRESQLLEEKESQLVEEIITEESGDEEMQEGEEELDATTTLLAMFKHRTESAATRMIDLKNLKPASGCTAPPDHPIKMSQYQNQPVPVVKRDILTGSERFFEDSAQKRRFRGKKPSDNIASSYHENAFSFTEKHGEELNELESSITRYFAQWEFQLNENKNILLYGFGLKEQLLEKYLAFHNNNENITIHFHGNDDLSTLDSTYLMLLENLFGSQHAFSNLDLIRKAERIRDYFKVIAVKSIFKLIVSIVSYPYIVQITINNILNI
jgi:hypothetical protein